MGSKKKSGGGCPQCGYGAGDDLPTPEAIALEIAIGCVELAPWAFSLLSPEDYEDPELCRIAEVLEVLICNETYSQRHLLQILAEDGDASLAIGLIERFDHRRKRLRPEGIGWAMYLALSDVQRRRTRRQAEAVRQKIRQAEACGDRDASTRYLAEYARLQRSLKPKRRRRFPWG